MILPTPEALWSFALIVGILTLTPGVDTALVLRSAVRGRRVAVGAIAGIQCGVLVWAVVAAVGVGAVLTASEIAYGVLRIAGAVYLIWLGGRMLVRAVRGTHPSARSTIERPDSFWAGLRQGLSTNLLNPKVGAFYVALLPQLIPAGSPALVWGAAFGAVHVLLGGAWLGAVALLAQLARTVLQRPAVARWIDGVVGAVIAAFGVRLALVH